MKSETISVRISAGIHRKLKIYAAKSEIDMVKIIDQSVINFMKEFSAEFLRDGCVPKSINKPKIKTKQP